MTNPFGNILGFVNPKDKKSFLDRLKPPIFEHSPSMKFSRYENLSETLQPLVSDATSPPPEQLPQPEWITPPHNHLFDPILPIIPPPLPPQLEKVYQDEFTFWKNQEGISEDLLGKDDEPEISDDAPRHVRNLCHCGNCMDCCTNGYRDFL